MREGEQRLLYVHPDLGYGPHGLSMPNALLVFEVELIKADASAEAQAASNAEDSGNEAETSSSMKVILFQPQIPQNTGNIARTCAVTGSDLVLVRPLGFSTANRHLKRAGLDYWNSIQR